MDTTNHTSAHDESPRAEGASTAGQVSPLPPARAPTDRTLHISLLLAAKPRQSTKQCVALVACVARKRATPAPARDLYISPWFRAARSYAERLGPRWFILSARHQLLAPDTVLAPYEQSLQTLSRSERQAWAERVFSQLRVQTDPEREELVVLAGHFYRDDLVPLCRAAGYTVHEPLRGLSIGRQLHWLTTQHRD